MCVCVCVSVCLCVYGNVSSLEETCMNNDVKQIHNRTGVLMCVCVCVCVLGKGEGEGRGRDAWY